MEKIKKMFIVAIGLALILSAGLVMAETRETKSLSRAVIKIDTLSCGGCFSSISAGLATLEGYSGMGANLFRKLIAIDFTAPLTADKVSLKLIEIGYPGNLEYVDTIPEKESFAFLESKRTGKASGGGGSCCSSGQAPGNSYGSQGSSGQKISPRGSCCTLPGVSQSTEDL